MSAANALVGLVARRTDLARPWDEVFNECSDRISDTSVFVGLAFNSYVNNSLALGMLVLTLLSSYLGIVGKATGWSPLSDVGAFCVDKALTGPKLAPRLSSNKTWSGVLENVLRAALALRLIAFAVPGIQLWQWGLFALAIGLGSI